MNASEIAGALRKRIASNALTQNDRLPPERELAAQFGVARGTVREALRQLEDGGFVERRPGSGTYVVWTADALSPSVVEQTRPLQLIDVRRGLEPHMARLAVLHATAADLAQAETHLEVMEGCGDDATTFADADELFHLALASCSQNPLLTWMMEKVHEVRTHAQWSEMRTLTLGPEIIAVYNMQHRAVLEKIRARDAEGAAAAMREHLATARRSLEDGIG